jgi:hypothetical protein
MSHHDKASRAVGIIVTRYGYFQKPYIVSDLFHLVILSIYVCLSKGRLFNDKVNVRDVKNQCHTEWISDRFANF